jgi:hypothetical protein
VVVVSELPWSTNEAADIARQRADEQERQRLADEHEARLMVSYPFPCEVGIANLRLPKRLTRADAERLKATIDALVMEE